MRGARQQLARSPRVARSRSSTTRGERTITTLGARLEPLGEDAAAAWEALGGIDGVYFTAGDGDALRAARDAARGARREPARG